MAVLRRFEVAKVSEVRLDEYWKEDISGGEQGRFGQSSSVMSSRRADVGKSGSLDCLSSGCSLRVVVRYD